MSSAFALVAAYVVMKRSLTIITGDEFESLHQHLLAARDEIYFIINSCHGDMDCEVDDAGCRTDETPRRWRDVGHDTITDPRYDTYIKISVIFPCRSNAAVHKIITSAKCQGI
jgi:hypothetical protein